jgi:hypothetical protein
MARTESEQLVFSVEARIAAMEKQMARAGRVTDRTFTGMENRSKRAAQNMERSMAGAASRVGAVMKSFGGAFLAGIAAGGVAGSTGALAITAKNLAAIGDEARRAGLGIREFQELKFVAEQNRIGVDSLTDGIKELNLRADEFIATGQGSAADAFKRLGFTAEELRTKLERPNELFLEIIGRLQQLDRAAQIRVADEVFGGTGGERFVQLIDQGEQKLRDTINAAQDLGAVVSDDLVKRADELDRKFGAIATTVSTGLKVAVVEATAALTTFIDEFKRVEARTTDSLRSRLDFAQRNLDAAKTRRDQVPGFLSGPVDMQIETSQREVDELTAELRKRGMNELRDGLTQQRNRLQNPVVPIVEPAKSSGGGGREKTIRDTTDAIREQIAALEEELQLVGATDLEYRIANEIRRAGAEATDDQRAKITSLVTAITAEEEALRSATEATEELREIGRDVLGGLVSDLQSGTSAADALANALNGIADRLINSGLDSLFGGGGGLGSIFGGGFKTNTTLGAMIGAIPGRANGGPVSKGRPYIVGERRPELFVPNQSGTILPKLPSMPSLPTTPNLAGISSQNNSGNVTVNFSPTIDARGADIEAVARIDQSLAKLKNEFSARVVQAIRQNNRAGVDFY